MILLLTYSALKVNKTHRVRHVYLLSLQAAAILTGCSVISLLMTLALPYCTFLPSMIILLLFMAVCIPKALEAYVRSLRHTVTHQQYLLANGATHRESIMPCIRKAMRAAFLPLMPRFRQSIITIALPVLFLGMILGGVEIWPSFYTTLFFWLGAFITCLIVFLVSVCLYDIVLFDKKGNLLISA